MINKTIFITGINGQDGCYLAKNALDNGFEVIGLQRPVPNYRTDQIVYRLKEQGIFDKLKFEVLDLRDKSKLKNLIKKYKPSHFAHLGSQSSVKKSDNYKKLTEESNFLVSKNIIQNLDETSRDTIFFFASSATIYEGYQDITVNEDTKPLPKTTYAKSKYKTQKLIREKLDDSDLQLNTGILFSHESEYRRPNFFSKKITEFLIAYYLGKKDCINVGDLFIKRDIGYAKEYTEGIFKVLSKNKKRDYILSSNRLYELKEFVDNCLNILNIKYEIIEEGSKISYLDINKNYKFIVSDWSEFREFDLRGIKGDNAKIKKDLDWQPKIKLEEICKLMINYELKTTK